MAFFHRSLLLAISLHSPFSTQSFYLLPHLTSLILLLLLSPLYDPYSSPLHFKVPLVDLWKRQYFFLTLIGAYSGYGFACPSYNASVKATIHELLERLFHHSNISHNIAAD